MGEGGQIWLKCITGDLIMMIRDKNNIFERVENFHADLAWNYPPLASDRSAGCNLIAQVRIPGTDRLSKSKKQKYLNYQLVC